ncbi:MAG: response regulator [Spirochaetaceae bacterium]|jgi:two-component system cell cycle response regulator|nr:response regulator [Spirochaetaceae bacterium]
MQKIIHVDNSDFFRKLMKVFLMEQGFEGTYFSHGLDALEALEKEDVSMLITGMALSDMDGKEFIKRVYASSYTGPIIVLTSNDSEEEQQALEHEGVKACIAKTGAWQEKLLPYLL